MNKKTIPELSVESKLLIERIRKAAEEEIITYAEMSNIIGGANIQKGQGYGRLASAKRCLERERIIIESVRNVGVKRMSGSLIANGSFEKTRTKIGRCAKRGERHLSAPDYKALTETEKTKINVGLSILGTIRHFTERRIAKAIEERVSKVNDPLALRATLEMAAKGILTACRRASRHNASVKSTALHNTPHHTTSLFKNK